MMGELQILYFVWDGFGFLLRSLSLKGGAGNVLAVILYTLLSLLPLLGPSLWMWKRRQRPQGADILLIVLSMYTFYLLYAFINPGLFSARLPAGLGVEGMVFYIKAVYGGLWLSILVSWLLLTWIRSLNDREILDRKKFLYRGMKLLLAVSILLSTAELLYSVGTDLTGRLVQIRGNEAGTGMDLIFAFLRAGVVLLSSGFLPVILCRIKRLLKAVEEGPFEAGELEEAKRLADVSRMAVTAPVLGSLVWNGGLFLCSRQLTQLEYQWEIPLFPLLAAFGSLILTRYLREAGELHRDNEMII